MGRSVDEVMTPDPVALAEASSVFHAACAMRDCNVGDVLVLDDEGRLCGILTDRDVVVRAVAEGADPNATTVGEICSRDLTTVRPGDSVERAVSLMRQRALRRLPVVANGRPVGIVSLGDLALDRDPDSALADIAAAPPNR